MVLSLMSKASTSFQSKTYFVCGVMILYLGEVLFKGLLIYLCISHIDYPQRRPVLFGSGIRAITP